MQQLRLCFQSNILNQFLFMTIACDVLYSGELTSQYHINYHLTLQMWAYPTDCLGAPFLK